MMNRRTVAFLGTLLVGVLAVGHTAEQKFFSDDPLAREPETQDASGAQPWDIDLFYDLSYNLFVTARQTPSGIRAGNVNTIDEVPDSSWFTNRIGSRALTVEEVVRGPVVGPAPAPREVDPHAREDRGRRARLHGPGRERADVLRVVRCASKPRRRHRRGRRRHEDLLGARLQPGRVFPDVDDP